MGYLISLETEVRRLVKDYLNCPHTVISVNVFEVRGSSSDLRVEVYLHNFVAITGKSYSKIISSECRKKEIDYLAYEILLDLVYGS
jgi:hypothetical protein